MAGNDSSPYLKMFGEVSICRNERGIHNWAKLPIVPFMEHLENRNFAIFANYQ